MTKKYRYQSTVFFKDLCFKDLVIYYTHTTSEK